MANIQDIHPNMAGVAMKTIEEIDAAIRAYQNRIAVLERAAAALKLVAAENSDPLGEMISAAVAGELAMPKRSPLANFRTIVRSNGESEAAALVTTS